MTTTVDAGPAPGSDAGAADEAARRPPSPPVSEASAGVASPAPISGPAIDEAPEACAGASAGPSADAALDSAPDPAADPAVDPTPDQAPDAAVAPPPRLDRPRIIAVANQKGGVGKTTTAVNLGAALADLGYRTLVIDLDPQANASSGLGVAVRELEQSMYDVLLDDLPLAACVVPTDVANLAVAPASLELAGAEIELVPAMSRELKLRSALAAERGSYDYVLIDCPPSLGLLTVNALAAATEVLLPIQCEYYALEGVGQLVQNVALVQRNLNPVLEVSTVVLVMYDARTKLADQVAQEVRNHFQDKVCRTVVPRTVRLSEAPSYGQPITAFDATSRGAIAYRALAEEVSHGAS